jgi:hypothetical protein
MPRKLAVLVTLLAALEAHAEPWTRMDTVNEALFAATVLVDQGQTVYGVHRAGLAEVNPVLGRHPSREAIWVYGAGATIAHAAVARLLPRPYRRAWQHVWIVNQLGYIGHNARMAGGFHFAF